MKTNNPMVLGSIAIVIAAGSFFGGMKYEQTRIPKQTSPFSARNGMMRQQTGTTTGVKTGTTNTNGMLRQGGNNMTNGQISSRDATSITVKMPNGSSKIIVLSKTTTIKKAIDGAQSDLTVGTNVNVFGTSNSDGSITAENIQISTGNQIQTPPAQ